MKIYLAAPFALASDMQIKAKTLTALGHEVVSRWHTGVHGKFDGDRSGMLKEAQEDLDDLDKADVLLAFTQPPKTTFSSGGRHVEFGYALASGTKTYVIGPVENVFHNCANEVFDTWDQFLSMQSELLDATLRLV